MSQTLRLRGAMPDEWRTQAQLSSTQKLEFTRHLALLLASGIELPRALLILHEQAYQPVTAEVVWTLLKRLESGHRFSSCCALFPGIFTHTYIAILKVAEESGRLHFSLQQLAEWLEKEEAQRQRLQAALVYPGLVLGVSLGMSFWLSYFILPEVLQGFDPQQVPWPTRLLIAWVNLIRQPFGLMALVLCLLGGAGGGYSYLRRPSQDFLLGLWRRLLNWPLLGPTLRDACLVRYASAAAVLSANGSTLASVLQLAATASGNPCLMGDAPRLISALHQGQAPSVAMTTRPELYGRLLPGMLGVAEETGRLDRSFSRCAQFLDQEVDYRFTLVQQSLEPFLLAFVALLVAFILLSVMLPLYAQLG